MTKSEKYVVHGAIIRCSGAAKPAKLKVSSNRTYTVGGKKVATLLDCAPIVNIPSFGVCIKFAGTPKAACVPAPAGPWKSIYRPKSVKNLKPLLEGSYLVCPIGGGKITIVSTAQFKANNKNFKIKCPVCGKDHRPDDNVGGDNVGQSTILAKNIHKGGAKKDPLYCGPWSLAAHHLISGQILHSEYNDDETNEFWAAVCFSFGYDVNCKENGIFLPTEMYLACAMRKPLHRGNHDSTETYVDGKATNKTYTKQVKARVDEVEMKIRNKDYCKRPIDLIIEMNDISSDVRGFVNKFDWTLTIDGRDYMSAGKGCCNCINMDEKLGIAQKIKENPTNASSYVCTRSHPLKMLSAGDKEKAIENIKNILKT